MVGYERILVAVDFSESTGAVLDAAAAFARAFGGRLIVLHVSALHGEGVGEAEERMGKAVPAGLNDLVAVRHVARALSPEIGILHAAREHDADLLVLGTHGHSGFKHVLIGSVAERVVQLSELPVLTVRRANHRFERP